MRKIIIGAWNDMVLREQKQMMTKIKQILENPDKKARGYTRWWWYGCAVNKHDIRRQLIEMADAHIGGVEIQVTYPVHEDDPDRHIHNIDFFSVEFFEILNFTVETANELNIEVDLTLGSGWPFGGPFISEDMSPDILLPYQIDIYGPKMFSTDFTCVLAGEIKKIILVKSEKGVLNPETSQDVTDQLKKTYIYNWPWGYKIDNLPVQEGLWKLFVFVSSKYRQQVGVPGPNMEGHVIDHCRGDVMDLYLRTVGSPLVKKLGADRLGSFFCDSIELGGNNWTPVLPETFKASRGYDLTPYMPALWSDMGDVTAGIRHDYYQTMSDLTLDNFFAKLSSWSRKNGMKARVQAHGTWADILKAYGLADIPEGETFGPGDQYEVNTIHRRIAASAGLVYDRPVVSNESFTWLRMPRFIVTPEMVRRAADAIFVDGMNHIVNHGYSYSPESEPAPGWFFYASTMLSDNNTWWPVYKHIGAYIHRVSALMQKGKTESQLAVYLPQGDIWSENQMSELHMSLKLEQKLGRERINNLQKSGYWFTYVNDEAICDKAVMTRKGMTIHHNSFKTLLVINTRYIPLKTAQAIEQFVSSGGQVIFVNQLPDKACGFVDQDKNSLSVKKIMKKLIGSGNQDNLPLQERNGTARYINDSHDDLIQALSAVLHPQIVLEHHSEQIGFIKKTLDEMEYYFLANISPESRKESVFIPVMTKGCQVIDMMTTQVVIPDSVTYSEHGINLRLSFDENQSLLIVCSPDLLRQNIIQKELSGTQKIMRSISLSTDWTLAVSGGNATDDMRAKTYALHELSGWEQLDELRTFCGQGVYTKTVNISSAQLSQSDEIWLEFDEVHVAADIYCNQTYAGSIWQRPFKIRIDEFLTQGLNQLEIRVYNLWINHCLSDSLESESIFESKDNAIFSKNEAEPVIEQWPYFSKVIDDVKSRRLSFDRERRVIKTLQPSGLKGAVKMTFFL